MRTWVVRGGEEKSPAVMAFFPLVIRETKAMESGWS